MATGPEASRGATNRTGGDASGRAAPQAPRRSTCRGCEYNRLVDGSEHIVNRQSYTAIVEREGDGYVALCPELDVASQGTTVEEATANLREAVELFLEAADPEEVTRRTRGEVFITRFEAGVG